MSHELENRAHVMSGGSRGIGLAIAVALAEAGARIALLAKTDQPHPRLPGTIHTAAQAIEAAGQALPVVGDVRDEAQVDAFVAAAAERWGGVDVVVNNASAINLAPIAALEPKRYDLMLDINVRGTFLLTRAAAPPAAPAGVRARARAHALAAAQHRPPLAARPRRLHRLQDGRRCSRSASRRTSGSTAWARTACGRDPDRARRPEPARRRPATAMSRTPEIVADAARDRRRDPRTRPATRTSTTRCWRSEGVPTSTAPRRRVRRPARICP